MVPPSPRGPDLERSRRRRRRTAPSRARAPRWRRGDFAKFGAAIDAALRTQAVEHMDDESYPEKGKLGIALGLHMMNVASASYRRFFTKLQPTLKRIEARHGRPARVLELACGAGGFAFALDALARRESVRVEVTASDIVPLYISRGQERAAREGVPSTSVTSTRST